MKWIILLVLLTGCTTVSYEAAHEGNVVEKFTLTTWFKSVDGLSAIRTPDLFGLAIDSTNTDDENVFVAIAEILKFYDTE